MSSFSIASCACVLFNCSPNIPTAVGLSCYIELTVVEALTWNTNKQKGFVNTVFFFFFHERFLSGKLQVRAIFCSWIILLCIYVFC